MSYRRELHLPSDPILRIFLMQYCPSQFEMELLRPHQLWMMKIKELVVGFFYTSICIKACEKRKCRFQRCGVGGAVKPRRRSVAALPHGEIDSCRHTLMSLVQIVVHSICIADTDI